jgi:hypothetical protein
MASPFEYTVTALFAGKRPSPIGTSTRRERARELAQTLLEASARAKNSDFLAASLLVSSRSSRESPGVALAELTVPAGTPLPCDADIDIAIEAGLTRIRWDGSLREQLLVAADFPETS